MDHKNNNLMEEEDSFKKVVVDPEEVFEEMIKKVLILPYGERMN